MPRRKRPIKRTALPQRRSRPKSVSERRKARQDERKAATGDLSACWLDFAGGCFGAVNGHEIIGRYAWAEGIYHAPNIVPLCNRHNGWVESNQRRAELLGLRLPGWVHKDSRDWMLRDAATTRKEAKSRWGQPDAPPPVPTATGPRGSDHGEWSIRYSWFR